MDQNSKKYTAFSTPQGHYNRMSFELKNAPATFQRMMNTALRGLINNHCIFELWRRDAVVRKHQRES